MTRLVSIFLLILAGCLQRPAVKPEKGPPPTPSISRPQLQKTFGTIWYSGAATLWIQYKNMNIVVDPLFADKGAVLPPGWDEKPGTSSTDALVRRDPLILPAVLPPMDYLFLTDLEPRHFGAPREPAIRLNMKIVAPPADITSLQRMGYINVKGLESGQRILLKKENAFLFASALGSKNPGTHAAVNAYLLEFDNGRNIFISGETVDQSALREFLYGLRDDGKEIDLAFIYAGGEQMSADIISLLNPKWALLLQRDSFTNAQFDEKRLEQLLKEQIFDGQLLFPKPGEQFPF